jgi:hypothetical protein
MLQRNKKYFLMMTMVITWLCCRKIYNPPAIQSGNHFFVVDGFVNTRTNSVSSFTLTHSMNLNESGMDFVPEKNAQITINTSSGNNYQLTDFAETGTYSSEPLNLDPNQTFQVEITTSDGNHYKSDAVISKPAPPIDSINWTLINDPVTGEQIQIFVNAHDPLESTHYYRWDYLETYEHNAFYQSAYGLRSGLVYSYPNYDSGTYRCYTTLASNSIILGSSIALSNDVISHVQIAAITKNDPRLDIEYSILVRQYALTVNAFIYWKTIQANSQSLGGLFDLQPSQIKGNYHNTTNPGDAVVGYLTAGSVSENRILISHSIVPDWKSQYFQSCRLEVTPVDPVNYQVYTFADTSYGPYYYSAAGLVVAPNDCLDCRYQGGSLSKPSYWP